MSHLGDAFKTRRLDRKLTTGQLARLAGYRNLTRGANRISGFEAGGKIAPDLLGKLAAILDINSEDLRRYAAEDYKEWLEWANEPVRPYLVVRHMACVYERVELSNDVLVTEAAEAYASRLAREKRRMVSLVLSRRLSIGFDATGKETDRREAAPDVPCEPFAVIGGKRIQFDFSGGAVLRPIDEPGVSS
jgi:hypothetical protein